jgi:hypothetical protein
MRRYERGYYRRDGSLRVQRCYGVEVPQTVYSVGSALNRRGAIQGLVYVQHDTSLARDITDVVLEVKGCVEVLSYLFHVQ